jgi:hypothetical protein
MANLKSKEQKKVKCTSATLSSFLFVVYLLNGVLQLGFFLINGRHND